MKFAKQFLQQVAKSNISTIHKSQLFVAKQSFLKLSIIGVCNRPENVN